MKMSVRAIAAVAAVSSVAATGAAVAAGPPGASGRSTQRAGRPVEPGAEQRRAARCLRAGRAGDEGRARRPARLARPPGDAHRRRAHGGVKAVGRLDGYLTGALTADAQVGRARLLRGHAAVFDLYAADIAACKLVRDYTSTDGVPTCSGRRSSTASPSPTRACSPTWPATAAWSTCPAAPRGGLKLHVAPGDRRASHGVRAHAALRRLEPRGAAQRSARATGTRATTFAGGGAAELVAYTAGDRPAARVARARAGQPRRRLRRARRRADRPARAPREPRQVRRRARHGQRPGRAAGRHAGAPEPITPVADPGRGPR